MEQVECRGETSGAPETIAALVQACSAITDYRILRDLLPQRLASLLGCRCVLLYQRVGEQLQFVSGSFDDKPGWSTALLTVAHINPIMLQSDVPEACAWHEQRLICTPPERPIQISVPLLYHHRVIGVLAVIHVNEDNAMSSEHYWQADTLPLIEAVAGIVALLLENTRLLERDRERIRELSLLNSISSQLHNSLYERERVCQTVIQRAHEIAGVDLSDVLEPLSSSMQSHEWIPPALAELLFQHFQEQPSSGPLLLERPGDKDDRRVSDYLAQLPQDIKTFFAFPLTGGRTAARWSGTLPGSGSGFGSTLERLQDTKVLGIFVGGYYRAYKLRREEVVLLQVLANQAGTVLENAHLIAEVMEARNESRRLLRKVVDDQRFKALILERIPSGLIATDERGQVTTFNRAAEAILGYHPYEVLGQPLTRFLDLGSLLPVQLPSDEHTTWLLPGEARSGTIQTEDRRGSEIILDVDLLPLHNDLGTPIGLLATFTDVTSMHHLEEEKRRLDRLALLGEMAANVAHEVRNPLASIKASMLMLRDDLSQYDIAFDEETQESVTVVLEEVERLDAIVRDLLLFARPRQLHRVKCDVARLCDRVLDLLKNACLEANVVVHRMYEDVPSLWVDLGQMEQIFINLCMNAIQAMPDGGVLTISCYQIPAAQKPGECKATIREEAGTGQQSDSNGTPRSVACVLPQNDTWVEIAVSDSGMGIPPQQLERIFQPFFTTKAHGIGLGLAITRRLVEDHGGSIRVEGQFGYGATIIVRLPVISDALQADGGGR